MPKTYDAIKTYKFKSGIEFQTIVIPRGTLLFRGLHYTVGSHYSSLFHDFVGYADKGRYSVTPTMNVFFYPVPYISDSVQAYNIYGIYATQYDLECILLVRPSDKHRGDGIDKLLIMCDKISEHDKCGAKMSEVDLCFTDEFIKKYPHINGYIALSMTDAGIFMGKYKKLIADKEYIKARHILASILTNAGGVSGVPEIVLHPFYFRHSECYSYGKVCRIPEHFVRYCIKDRAHFNYFPLLYLTNNGIYSFTQLANDVVLREMSESERIYDGDKGASLHMHMQSLMESLLGDGYQINGIRYRAMIDKRTGFYTLIFLNRRGVMNKRGATRKRHNRKLELKDDMHTYIHSNITYPKNGVAKHIINTSTFFDDMLYGLHTNGFTLKKEYVLDRGNMNNFAIKYHVEEVFDRPDLNQYRVRRLHNRNKTLKNISLAFSFMDPEIDLDEVESISSEF